MLNSIMAVVALLILCLLDAEHIVFGQSNPFGAEVYLPFEVITNNRVPGGTYEGTFLQGTTASVVKGIHGNGIYLSNTVMTIGNKRDSCFWSPDLCANGITIAIWVKIDKTTGETYIFSNGGQTTHSFGVALVFKTNLLLDVRDKSNAVRAVSSSLKEGKWSHIVGTYNSTSKTVHLFIDGVYVSSGFASADLTSTTSYNEYIFGSSNRRLNDPAYRCVASVDEFLFWPEIRDPTFIKEMYSWYIPQAYSRNSVYIRHGKNLNGARISIHGGGSPLNCARRCDGLSCASFDYDVTTGTCNLFSNNSGEYHKHTN